MVQSNAFPMRVAIGSLVAIVLLSCNRRESPPQPTNTPTLLFTVDSALVETAQSDTALGIVFAPPRGWKKVDERLLRRAEVETMKKMSSPVPAGDIRVYYGYVEPETGSVITITRLADFDTSDASQTMRIYQDRALQADSSAMVKSTVFYHHGIKVHQLLTFSTINVSFTVIFSSLRLKRPIRFDFVFPREVYPRFARTIESVLGSVELL